MRSTTAEQALVRALLFLRTSASDAAVRGALAETGFGQADIDEGWRLLRAACSVPPPAASPRRTGVRDATRALEAFAQTMLPRARAATRRFFPDYEAYLFAAPARVRGASTVTVAIFVERCGELASPKRRKTRERDRELLALLARRGITHAVLEDTRRNVAVATGSLADSRPARSRAPNAALDDLHAWVRDWSDCAKTVVTRRDWLIRLGIGRRRARAPSA